MGKKDNKKFDAKSSQRLAKSAARAIEKQQPKSTREKIVGINSKHDAGIDPITNLSYPKQKGRSKKR
jgi:hypothetical protein